MLAPCARRLVASFAATLICGGCFIDGGPFEEGAAGNGGTPGTDGSATGTGGTPTTSTGTDDCSAVPPCDDGDPCTVDACPSGTCEHTPASDGTAAEDLDLHDCVKPVCQGGAVVSKIDKSQSPDIDPSDCSVTYCLDAGGTQTEPDNEGEPCGSPSGDVCHERLCDGGACELVTLADDTLLVPGDTGIPNDGYDCRDLVCLGGVPELVPNILNCDDTGPTNCFAPACTPDGQCKTGAGDSILAPAGFPCDTDGDGSLDGECDGLGGDSSHCQP